MRRPLSSSLTPDIPPTYRTLRRARGGLRWFVAYCNPQCEKRAALCLESRGYETFLPLRTKWQTQFKRRIKVDRALFPRYLFFALRPGQDFWGLHNAHGVEAVLRNGDMPVEAPRNVVDELRRVCASGAFDETRMATHEARMPPGTRVEVAAGPWATFSATVSRVLSAESVEILVRIFGRETTVKVPVAALREAC